MFQAVIVHKFQLQHPQIVFCQQIPNTQYELLFSLPFLPLSPFPFLHSHSLSSILTLLYCHSISNFPLHQYRPDPTKHTHTHTHTHTSQTLCAISLSHPLSDFLTFFPCSAFLSLTFRTVHSLTCSSPSSVLSPTSSISNELAGAPHFNYQAT